MLNAGLGQHIHTDLLIGRIVLEQIQLDPAQLLHTDTVDLDFDSELGVFMVFAVAMSVSVSVTVLVAVMSIMVAMIVVMGVILVV